MGLLRILLAIAVVIEHSAPVFGFRFTGGLVAVEIFYIISGFYMTMILDKKYTGNGSYLLFLSNRFLRLYPMFWVVLGLTVILSIVSVVFFGKWLRLTPYIEYYDALAFETLLFISTVNATLLGQHTVLFLGVSQGTGAMYFTHDFNTSSPMLHEFLLVPQAWSLGIEILFYIIAPFVVRRSIVIVALLILFSMGIRIFTYYYLGFTNDPWTYRFFPSELALFLLGTVSYRLYASFKIQKTKLFGCNPANVLVGLFFLALLFHQFIPKAGHEHLVNWVLYGFCCLVIPYLFELSRTSKIDSRIGELSYPVYISHILVIALIPPLLPALGGQAYKGEWAVVFTMLVSYLLIRLISDPIEKIRQARVKVERKI